MSSLWWQIAGNCIIYHPISTIFWGSMSPDPPSSNALLRSANDWPPKSWLLAKPLAASAKTERWHGNVEFPSGPEQTPMSVENSTISIPLMISVFSWPSLYSSASWCIRQYVQRSWFLGASAEHATRETSQIPWWSLAKIDELPIKFSQNKDLSFNDVPWNSV